MKALLQVSVINTDARLAKTVRLFGIPIYHRIDLFISTLLKKEVLPKSTIDNENNQP